jgi:Cellulase (glycosyl hydrolase family 5)
VRKLICSVNVLVLLSLSLATSARPLQVTPLASSSPVSIHPKNSKYFLFRGKPLALITATEHYGSVINSRFDFERYLQDAADKKQTLTRLFLLFRELQNQRNPYSPLKVESPDFVTPYLRTGPGKALDGELKFNLDQWNPAYFARLHRFLARASELGIVVEVTLFSNTYAKGIWALNPLNSENNVNGLKALEWPEYNTLKDPELFKRQAAFVRKIIQEINHYDNLYYEICNEPGGGVKGFAPPSDVDAWQAAVGKVVREEMSKLSQRHLVFGSEAFSYTPKFNQGTDASFKNQDFDAVNVHPLPDTHYGGRAYQMGNFMSKELMLSEFRDYCLATYRERKPMVMDEDNCASLYRDEAGWTIHRKRAWTALLSGSHYDYIDFSINAGAEAGTEDSRAKIRTWMKNLSEFFHSFDFVRSRPLTNWLQSRPSGTIESVLGIEGEEYLVYLADAREVTDPAANSPIQAVLKLPIPAGRYEARLYSPASGGYSPAIRMESTGLAEIDLPAFREDIVIRILSQPRP